MASNAKIYMTGNDGRKNANPATIEEFGKNFANTTTPEDHVRKNANIESKDIWMKALKKSKEESNSRSRTYFAKRLIVLFLFLFLIVFIIIMDNDPDAFAISNNDESSDSVVNGIYYWGTLTSTVGFGDICPKKAYAKMITTIYQLILFSISMGGIWYFTDGRIKSMMKALHREQKMAM